MGNWVVAIKSSEDVLTVDPSNYKAILVKAEALFNLCYFEHSMVLFHRGQVSSAYRITSVIKQDL